MAIVLLLVYVALSFFNDDHGTLGTDTGGKVATLRAMSIDHESRPDVGYWAAQWDPKGDLHPIYYTFSVRGRWLQVTTLPMLYGALPLYNLWGYRGALLLPMLGGVAAALAAAALARRLGSSRPWVAFWIVGLASPLTIYALDFWEHSIGVALLLWAAVALFDAVDRRPRRAALAGLLVGAAFLLRTEALVYGAIGTGVALAVVYARRRRVGELVRFGLEFAVGFVVVSGLGAVLELATVGQLLRFTRAGAAATSAGGSVEAVPGSRLDDAIGTTVNLRSSLDVTSYLGGAAAVALVVVIVVLARRMTRDGRVLEPRDSRVLVGFGVLLGAQYAIRFGQGLGFVPGLFAAAPIAAVGLALGWTPARRLVTGVAVGALPCIWLFQFRGGAAPQWGGRYQLATTMLLVIVGLIALESLPRAIGAAVIVLSIAVTGFGVLWLHERSHSIADAVTSVQRLPQPVVVSDVAHLFREGGAFYDRDRHWLTAVTASQQDRAAEIVRLAGYDEFAFITLNGGPPRQFQGYRAGATETIQLFSDVDLRVTTYDAVSTP